MHESQSVSRREFVALAASLPAAAPLLDYARSIAETARALDEPLVRALAETVLPTELGADGMRAASSRFLAWARGYVAGAELDHGYGTGELTHAGRDPVPTWSAQLSALEREARARHASGFGALTIARREALVRAAVNAAQQHARAARTPSANDIASGAMPSTPESMPAVAEAPHVAIALLAHFYESSEANDLCYGVAVGKQTCRPLAAQREKPVALARRRGT